VFKYAKYYKGYIKYFFFFGVWPPVYGLEIDLRLRQEFIYFATVMKPAMGSTQPSIQYSVDAFLGAKGQATHFGLALKFKNA
jgi:hypothetical protein